MTANRPANTSLQEKQSTLDETVFPAKQETEYFRI
jgi:hypothetical protein